MRMPQFHFGRDKPSLTDLAHGRGAAVERRRAIGRELLFRPVSIRAMLGPRMCHGRTPVWQRLAWRLPLVLVPILVLVLDVIGGGFADCRVTPNPILLAGEIDAVMEVNAARACRLTFEASSLNANDLEVATPPQRGQVTLRRNGHVVYRPDGNFQGDDAFALAVRDRVADDPRANLRVRVNVR
jgi:hypothetical protein